MQKVHVMLDNPVLANLSFYPPPSELNDVLPLWAEIVFIVAGVIFTILLIFLLGKVRENGSKPNSRRMKK